MSGSRSKNKGKTWEREVANDLTEIYGETFIRVPHSGAYIGGKNTFRKATLGEAQIRSMKGDITPPETWTKFNCECKSYADFPFHQTLQGECKQLEAWLDQLMEVADANDLNLLIMKFNRKGKFVAVPVKHDWTQNFPHIYYQSPKHGSWKIFDYDLFWQHNQTLVKTLST